MSLLQITNGAVYDPTNGIDGVVRDIRIQDEAYLSHGGTTVECLHRE